jgi:hypothetical protein
MKRQHIIWFILGMGLLASMSSCTSATADTLPNIIVVRPAWDKAVSPAIYEVMCRTAKDKGFKFKNIQLS